MASLKDLKNRISSVKSTQKITKAMKMVAAAKLRKAQEAAEASRPYSEKLEEVMIQLAQGVDTDERNLLTGSGSDQKHLVIVATSSRGLCGGFNATIAKAAHQKISSLLARNRDVKIICIGRKGYDLLKSKYGKHVIEVIEGTQKKTVEFATVDNIAQKVTDLFNQGDFDVCTMFYNKFVSAISQEVQQQQLIPCGLPEDEDGETKQVANPDLCYEFEPEKEKILNYLLPKNLTVQIYHALLENQASEMGARMTAMDNATRNAGEMIDRLTLVYNRTRQAAITTELIEIISGAEAL